MSLLIYFVLLFLLVEVTCKETLPKSFIIQTTNGEPWPMPQSISTSPTQVNIDPDSFSFIYNETSHQCDLLTNAFLRYYKLIFFPETYWLDILEEPPARKKKFPKRNMTNVDDTKLLKSVNVNIRNMCEQWPTFESNESYSLTIKSGHAMIDAITVWGALRALETFSQLVHFNKDHLFVINETTINDYPRFQHRGLLFDTSTHFVSLDTIKINLEAMAQSKLNVFHFHITDDQSFPYQSRTYPSLSENGAFDHSHIYSQEAIAEILEFGRQRGIRLLMEFDSPAHSQSWEKAVDVLTKCYDGGKPTGEYGPMDPSRNSTFDILENFFREIASVFPDQYLHLGGDEVDFDCWMSNPNVTEFMHQMGFGTNYSLLEQYFMQRVIDIASKNGKGYAIWQDIIDDGVTVKPDTIVQLWIEPQQPALERVTKLGYRTLLSTCWYLNLISYGQDWYKYYQCEPHNFTGTEEQKKLVIGGEACMWGEFVDTSNIISTTWPRAAVPAERLWSSRNLTDPNAAAPRLEEHRCRYLRRGIAAAPVNGPSFCPIEYKA